MTLQNIVTLEKEVATLADKLEQMGIDPVTVTRQAYQNSQHPLVQRYIRACKALTFAIYSV
jgi:hypothetical protein